MSEILVDNLTGKTTANDITVTVGSSATMSLEQGLAKCWGNWRHATNTYSDSFGISSGVDDGTGDYTHNFTNNTTNSDYVSQISLTNNINQWWTNSQTTSNFGSRTYTGSASSDENHLVSILGDLA